MRNWIIILLGFSSIAHAQVDTIRKYYLGGQVAIEQISNGNINYYWKNGNIQRQMVTMARSQYITNVHFDSLGNKKTEVKSRKNGSYTLTKFQLNGIVESKELKSENYRKYLEYDKDGNLIKKTVERNGPPVICFVSSSIDSVIDSTSLRCWCEGSEVFWDEQYYVNQYDEEVNYDFKSKIIEYNSQGKTISKEMVKRNKKRLIKKDNKGNILIDTLQNNRVEPLIQLDYAVAMSFELSPKVFDTPNPLTDTVVRTYRYNALNDSTVRFDIIDVYYDKHGNMSIEMADLFGKEVDDDSLKNTDFKWYQHGLVIIGISKMNSKNIIFFVNDDIQWKNRIPNNQILTIE